tara:strand:+ start:186 stop:1709 length:1524 start_codon:yes stop_codon:yes gene_type:complete
MKIITLFHSYNYISNNFYITNNKIYDKNNNKLSIILLNVPTHEELYNISIKKKLKNKIFSFKKNKVTNNSFYTTHNLKISININYNLLYEYVNNNSDIPDKNILFKLLKLNFLNNIDFESPLSSILTINKNYSKKFDFNNYVIEDPQNNIVKIYDLYFDLNNNKILKKYTTLKIFSNIKIIFYDILEKLINELFDVLNNEDIIIITNNSNSKILWQKLFKRGNISVYEYEEFKNNKLDNKNFYYVILDNVLIQPKLIYNQLIYLNDNIDDLIIQKIVNTYSFFYNFDINNLCEKTLINILKQIYFRNYKNTLIKNRIINIYSKTIKNNNKFTAPNYNFLLKKNHTNVHCVICFEQLEKNNYCITQCNHSYCKSCIDKSLLYSNNCAYCRVKINKIQKIEYNHNDILNKKKLNNIGNKLIYLIQLIKKNRNIILIYEKYNIKNIKNILNFLNLNITIIKNSQINYKNIITENKKISYIFLEDQSLFKNSINTIINNNVNTHKHLYFIN